MATATKNLLYDCSTQANFLAWCQAISDWMITAGWVQTNDPAPIMFSTLSITACSATGGNGVYTYTLTSGRALAVNQALYITGMTNAGNNGTFVITALGAGTFTVVNGSAVTESGSSGAVTAMAGNVLTSVQSNTPSSTNTGLWNSGTTYAAGQIVFFQGATYMSIAGANTNHQPPNASWWSPYAYEIWKTNDGLTTIYLKLEYMVTGANAGAANSHPCSYQTTGTGTAGNGFLNGNTTNRTRWLFDNSTNFTNASGTGQGPTTQYFVSYFSGSSGRINVRMFASCPTSGSPFYYYTGQFGLERDHDNTGVDGSNFYTVWSVAYSNVLQQSVHFTLGTVTAETSQLLTYIRSSGLFGGQGTFGSLLRVVFPFVGGLGNQLLGIMGCLDQTSNLNELADYHDGQVITVCVFGVLHTYLVCLSYGECYYAWNGNYGATLMRFE